MIARSTRIDHAPHYESPHPARCGDAPQGRARPVAGNQREMAANGGANTHHPAQRPRDKAQLTPKPTLVPPPATPQTARKGRLNFLYSVLGGLARNLALDALSRLHLHAVGSGFAAAELSMSAKCG